MPRDERIEIRVAADEKARMQSCADGSGRKLSDWLRVVALEAVPPGEIAVVTPASESSPPRVDRIVNVGTAASPAIRTCQQCPRTFTSPTLPRCQCGGKILPEPS